MATERLCLCKQCGNKFPKSELIKFKSKNMCKKCYAIEKKLADEKADLCATIKQLYKIDYVMPGYLKQIKQFREEYNFSYTGMKLTLLYCKNVLNLEFSTSRGLGIIPYKYEEAKKDYMKKQQLAKQIKDKSVAVNKVRQEKVHISTENTYFKSKIINLEEVALC